MHQICSKACLLHLSGVAGSWHHAALAATLPAPWLLFQPTRGRDGKGGPAALHARCRRGLVAVCMQRLGCGREAVGV